jgi:hypothetical protein
MELQLLQAYLEIVKAKAKGSSETLIKAQANAVIKRDNKLMKLNIHMYAYDELLCSKLIKNFECLRDLRSMVSIMTGTPLY